MIKSRVLEVATKKGIPKERFFQKIGLKYGNFKGKAKFQSLSSDNLAIIIAYHPEINPEWLITGRGSMLREEGESKDNINITSKGGNNIIATGNSSIKLNEKAELELTIKKKCVVIETLEKQINSLSNRIEYLKGTLSTKDTRLTEVKEYIYKKDDELKRKDEQFISQLKAKDEQIANLFELLKGKQE